MQAIHVILISLYIPPMVAICIFGAHRLWVLLRIINLQQPSCERSAKTLAYQDPPMAENDLPTVTVQLPMYNEARVAHRAIDAACGFDYPAEKLQIQILDDSEPQEAAHIEKIANTMSARGHRVQYLHRTERTGYKAGALADGLTKASGEFVAIFDADFVPKPDFLRRLLPSFSDARVGMVQARWSHLNANENRLTRAQSILLDGHFVLEQNYRFLTKRWFNFNGTAGVWRRACIDDAGGWQRDTLTEDTDLSYRAQLRGWNFVYRPDVNAPAELPPTVTAFCNQQHRWNKGLMQTAMKLSGEIIRARVPLRCKTESLCHLISPMIYLSIALLVALAIPATATLATLSQIPPWLALTLGSCSLALGMGATGLFYLFTQLKMGRRAIPALLDLPLLLALGIGISLMVSRGVFEALIKHDTPFVRTPKFNGTPPLKVDRGRTHLAQGLPELLLGTLLLACFVITCLYQGTLIGAPFVFLFALSFGGIGLYLFRESKMPVIPFSQMRSPEAIESTLSPDKTVTINRDELHPIQMDRQTSTTRHLAEPSMHS